MPFTIEFKTLWDSDTNNRSAENTRLVSGIHSGNSGDIIYSLPTVHALGIRHFIINLCADYGFSGRNINQASAMALAPLLLAQDYIDRVTIVASNLPLEYLDQPLSGVDYVLDKFRLQDVNRQHLAISHALAFKAEVNLTDPWLKVPGDPGSYPIVVALNARYRAFPKEYWLELLTGVDGILTVGLPQDFQSLSGVRADFKTSKDFLEMAGWIKGAKLFMGNQSLAYALAEAMKVPRMVEQFPTAPNAYPVGRDGYIAPATIMEAKKIVRQVLGNPPDLYPQDPTLPDIIHARDLKISQLEQALYEKGRNLEKIQGEKLQLEGFLQARAVRLVGKCYQWRDRLFPQGSIQRKILNRMLRVFWMPVRLFSAHRRERIKFYLKHKGVLALLWKIIEVVLRKIFGLNYPSALPSVLSPDPSDSQSPDNPNTFTKTKRYANGRLTITSFVPFNFLPKNFGGGVRIMNVYEGLSGSFNVNLVGVRGFDGGQIERYSINENFTVYLVPMNKDFCDLLLGEQEKAGGYLHDILLTDGYKRLPALTGLCQALKPWTDIFVSSHPYFFKMLLEYCKGKYLVYEAHNVDYDLKKSYFPKDNAHAGKYLEMVREVEAIACREANLIMTVSEEDTRQLCRAYNIGGEKTVLVPNGIDVFSLKYRGKKPHGNTAIFMGSAHGPNIEAVEFIIKDLAPKNGKITYLIVGNLLDVFKDRKHPANVKFTGMVDEKTKISLLQTAAVAINPMFSGSGTNLKIFDYAASGIPIISTPFGMRGLETLQEGVWLAGSGDFLSKIEEVLALPENQQVARTRTARTMCEKHFDKTTIIADFVEKIKTSSGLTHKIIKPQRIAIEGRILHRNVSGTERYISEILKNLLLMEGRECYEIGLVNNGHYKAADLDFCVPYISSEPAIDLYHRTYQPSNHFEIMELLLAKRSVYSFLDLILCKYPDYFGTKADHEKFVQHMRLALGFSDRIIAISESAKKDVMDTFGVPENKIDVVYLGLDMNKFKKLDSQDVESFRQEFSLPDKYLLYLGTDYPHKNLVNLLIAFAQIMNKEEMKDYFLVIAGNKGYQAGQKYLAKYLDPVKKRVINLGHFPDDKITHLYNAADIFVYPSLYEGFGLPVLEAFACEVPLVCSQATSLPEVAGDAAYMVDATDPGQIAKAITNIVRDPVLRQSFVEKGRRRVKEFTWEKCAKNTYEVYRRALADPCANEAKKDESLLALLNSVMESNLGHLKNPAAENSLGNNIPMPGKKPSLFNPFFILAKLRQVRSYAEFKKLAASAMARLAR
jgi:glycosyltransferase involved in cell wall biosynthesis